MKAAYADPPYLNMGQKMYGKLHPEAHIWDSIEAHRDLVADLERDFDCWALSLHVPSLRDYMEFLPDDVRIAAWVKPFCSFKPNVKRAWSWEPVIFKFHPERGPVDTWRDHIQASIAMKRGFPGAKPDEFCIWMFEGLGLQPGDEFVDLFPGSGAVSECWAKWSEQPEQYELQAQG